MSSDEYTSSDDDDDAVEGAPVAAAAAAAAVDAEAANDDAPVDPVGTQRYTIVSIARLPDFPFLRSFPSR